MAIHRRATLNGGTRSRHKGAKEPTQSQALAGGCIHSWSRGDWYSTAIKAQEYVVI